MGGPAKADGPFGCEQTAVPIPVDRPVARHPALLLQAIVVGVGMLIVALLLHRRRRTVGTSTIANRAVDDGAVRLDGLPTEVLERVFKHLPSRDMVRRARMRMPALPSCSLFAPAGIAMLTLTSVQCCLRGVQSHACAASKSMRAATRDMLPSWLGVTHLRLSETRLRLLPEPAHCSVPFVLWHHPKLLGAKQGGMQRKCSCVHGEHTS